MAYDEALAERIREQLLGEPVVEKRMFGGLAFLLGGHMAVSAQCRGGFDVAVRAGAAGRPPGRAGRVADGDGRSRPGGRVAPGLGRRRGRRGVAGPGGRARPRLRTVAAAEVSPVARTPAPEGRLGP